MQQHMSLQRLILGEHTWKKLMDDRLGKNNPSYGKDVESYTIETEHKVRTSTPLSRKVMVRWAQIISWLGGII